jgi:alkylation response protein AidB-like acyl-CoA dehydrogenase
LELFDTNGAPAEPSDQWPLGTVLALVLAGPILGAARAVADAVTDKAPGRPISYTTYMTTAASSVAVTELARARVEIDTAWLLAFEAAAYVDACGAGAPRDLATEARMRGLCAYLTELLRTGVNRLLNVAGAGAFAQSNPVQRFWRDINVASRHAFLATNPSMETYGRSLLGLDPIMFVV